MSLASMSQIRLASGSLGVCFVFLVSAVAPVALAGPIEIVSDGRYLRAEADWSYDGSDWSDSYRYDDTHYSVGIGGRYLEGIEVSNDSGYYAPASVGRAGQDTTAGPAGFSGSGYAGGQGGYEAGSGGDPADESSYYWYEEYTTGTALSSMDITFDVLDVTPFEFAVSFLSGGSGTHSRHIEHRAWLYRPGEPGSLFDLSSSESFDAFEQGMLDPGRYALSVRSRVFNVDERSGMTATFAFSMVVPEPGTAMLVGIGLLGVAANRRRCRAAAALEWSRLPKAGAGPATDRL